MFEMTAMMEIIKKLIEKMKTSNPYSLVLKGGTALAYHHLNWHRESEDLDFDSNIEKMSEVDEIVKWICGLLDELVNEEVITHYVITKASFAQTQRYHMKIKLVSYKEFLTKIDIDFRDIKSEIEYDGELGFYSSEHMLISKIRTYISRGTLKDIYDISYLLRIVDHKKYSNREKLVEYVDMVISKLEDEDINKIYSRAFENVDLKFKSMKKRDLPAFKNRTLRELKVFRNQIMK